MTVCFVCEQMATRKQKKQPSLPVVYDSSSRITELCVLCARPFCDKHKLQGSSGLVCEVNHLTCYGKHGQISGIFPDLKTREKHLEENRPCSLREFHSRRLNKNELTCIHSDLESLVSLVLISPMCGYLSVHAFTYGHTYGTYELEAILDVSVLENALEER